MMRWSLGGLGWLLFSAQAFASRTIGETAESLLTPVTLVGQLSLAVCIIAGLCCTIAGVMFYKAYRENPQYMPLGKPVFYFLLGLALLCMPFVWQKAKEQDLSIDTRISYLSVDPDLPLPFN